LSQKSNNRKQFCGRNNSGFLFKSTRTTIPFSKTFQLNAHFLKNLQKSVDAYWIFDLFRHIRHSLHTRTQLRCIPHLHLLSFSLLVDFNWNNFQRGGNRLREIELCPFDLFLPFIFSHLIFSLILPSPLSLRVGREEMLL